MVAFHRKEKQPLALPPGASSPMDEATLALLYAFLAGVSDPGRKMSDIYGRVQRASAAADRIFAFLDEQPTIVSPKSAIHLEQHHAHIEFKDVSFNYPGTQLVLKDIALKVRAGECLAIVGHNGCGKSTLLNLIPRLYDPVAGQVLVDGIDLRQLDLINLRSQIGLVSQEILLFNDTVANNIRFGDPNATDEEIVQAAQKAYVHRFIDMLPQGYETNLGERAVKLSGGQRQRISLARAILRDPAILLLDEATSSLDVESESLIHKALKEFIRNRTTFLVTHRLGTLELADRIVVMDSGVIVDVGTHAELLERCGLYRRLRELHSASRMSA